MKNSCPIDDDDSGAEDETLTSARARLLRAVRHRAVQHEDDDAHDLLCHPNVQPEKRRRRLHKLSENSTTDSERGTSDSDADSSRSDDDAADDVSESDDAVNLSISLGLREPSAPAPLLSEAAAVGAVWKYCPDSGRPAWSTSQMSTDAVEAEQRANDRTLAVVEAELMLSRHEAPARVTPAVPSHVRAPEGASARHSTPPSAAAIESGHAAAALARRAHAAHHRAPSQPPRSSSVGGPRPSVALGSGGSSSSLTKLMRSRFPSRGDLLLRTSSLRPPSPTGLRDATGSAGASALARRHESVVRAQPSSATSR